MTLTMQITCIVMCIVMCIISFLSFIGDSDEKHKPAYLTGTIAFMALLIAIELLLK